MVMLLSLPVSLLLPRTTIADEDDHIFCVFKESSLVQSDERRVFYTAVFPGDYSWTVGYQNEFGQFLEDEYGDDLIFERYCFFEASPRKASRDLERMSDDDRRSSLYLGGAIMTRWAPDNFVSQDIQDFRIQISSDEGSLEVCVRDHECEDGDRIQITVAGRESFSGEIDNDWKCENFQVISGERYKIELFAINGTGRKGNCSYADVNTGEIRVRSQNTVIQSWKHRGGAGSRAEIIVEAQ